VAPEQLVILILRLSSVLASSLSAPRMLAPTLWIHESPLCGANRRAIRTVSAMSALRLMAVMYALPTRGHSTLPAPASWDEEPKQIGELQSSHAKQRGKRAPKKGCAVSHAARCGQSKEKESYRDQRVHRVVVCQARPCNPRK
jgi:hypothetical protein